MVIERDVPITLRDGVVVYADVYLPQAAARPLPGLLAWGSL